MLKSIIAASLAAVVVALTIIGLPGELTAQVTEDPSSPRSNAPVLVELFTSQGCSSCPPADRLAHRLDGEDGLVIISRPVDYWDRLGWKDTLASPRNTALQRAYARRGLGGYNGVYTPQTVVAGTFGEVGSDERALRRQIDAARRLPKSAQLHVKPVEGAGFAVGLSGETTNSAQLVLLAVSYEESVAIGRGENRGRTIRYTNALIGEDVLATWRGGKQGFAIRDEQLRIPGADRYAVVLREPGGGRVLAARWLPDAS
ncbi:MAG: DUF1223 domain-containing protein [Pseudomonadota bacterium]